MSKKAKLGIAITAAVLFSIALIFFIVNKPSSTDSNSIVGTWYSDKPDSVTFSKDGTYSFAAWNGGNPWLTFGGTYTENGDSVILQSTLDGTTVLTISKAGDGSMILSGKYTYYKTEDAAKAAIAAAEDKAAEDAANIISDTVDNLLGEWTSRDGTTLLTFDESEITIDFEGNEAVPADIIKYTYEVLNDKQMKITGEYYSGTYNYRIYEENGTWYLNSPVNDYASTYTKGSLSDKEREERYNKVYGTPRKNVGSNDTATAAEIIGDHKQVINSEKNPDKSEYTAELSSYVNEMLLGTWKGTFDEWPSADSTYWSYTFSGDGKYTFTDGSKEETGTYTVTSDPNNNYYHSAMTLTNEGGTRTVQFYFTTTDPVKMITDDQTDPTFLKS